MPRPRSLAGWLRVALVALTAACSAEPTEPAPQPGRPEHILVGNWVQGEWGSAYVWWPEADDQAQPTTTTTLRKVECDGCEIVETPEERTITAGVPFELHVVPRTDELFEVRATLRFDATGDEQTIAMQRQGDHEVALEAQCRMIDAAKLTDQRVDDSLFRGCDTPRLSGDAVVIFPEIRTFRGRALFPFDTLLPGRREFAQLQLSSGSSRRGYSEVTSSGIFIEVPAPFSGSSVTVTAPLADGTMASATVAMPAAQ